VLGGGGAIRALLSTGDAPGGMGILQIGPWDHVCLFLFLLGCFM
jgi:hypothetical protein